MFKNWSNYAKGMAEYVKWNNVVQSDGVLPETTMLSSIVDESAELVDAIINLDPNEIVLEFFDIVNSVLKMVVLTITPSYIYVEPYIWYAVYPFVFPSGNKLAKRFESKGCIRNHVGKTSQNHRCRIYCVNCTKS